MVYRIGIDISIDADRCKFEELDTDNDNAAIENICCLTTLTFLIVYYILVFTLNVGHFYYRAYFEKGK